MEEFTIRLNNVPDSYYSFVVAVMTYVKNKESRLEVVESFMDSNPTALSADILEFISNQDDFYEDAADALAEAEALNRNPSAKRYASLDDVLAELDD